MTAAPVLIVGAGIAGVACGQVLQDAGVPVRLLDRGRVPGGRMASRRFDERYVDTGASYFTVRDERFQRVVRDWQDRGLAREWTDTFVTVPGGQSKTGPVRWAAPDGLRSLVTDLGADLEIEQTREVSAVTPAEGSDGLLVDGAPTGAVVLAMPDPQALRLLDPALSEARSLIQDREWEPALALVARLPDRSWDLEGAFVDDEVLSWVADDGSRRGDGAPVLVAHSTPTFARPRLADPEAAGPELVAALRHLLDLPEPTWTYVQRWTFSKPTEGREEPFGLVGPAHQTIGLCGDGWGASKVEAAWLSGHLLGEALAARA